MASFLLLLCVVLSITLIIINGDPLDVGWECNDDYQCIHDCSTNECNNAHTMICTKTNNKCIINCNDPFSCNDALIYTAATNTIINCNQPDSCTNIEVHCGLPKHQFHINYIEEIGYNLNDFNNSINECIINYGIDSIKSNAEITCNGNINKCIINATDINSKFQSSTLECNLDNQDKCYLNCPSSQSCINSTIICNYDTDCKCFDNNNTQCSNVLIIPITSTTSPTQHYTTVTTKIIDSITSSNNWLGNFTTDEAFVLIFFISFIIIILCCFCILIVALCMCGLYYGEKKKQHSINKQLHDLMRFKQKVKERKISFVSDKTLQTQQTDFSKHQQHQQHRHQNQKSNDISFYNDLSNKSAHLNVGCCKDDDKSNQSSIIAIESLLSIHTPSGLQQEGRLKRKQNQQNSKGNHNKFDSEDLYNFLPKKSKTLQYPQNGNPSPIPPKLSMDININYTPNNKQLSVHSGDSDNTLTYCDSKYNNNNKNDLDMDKKDNNDGNISQHSSSTLTVKTHYTMDGHVNDVNNNETNKMSNNNIPLLEDDIVTDDNNDDNNDNNDNNSNDIDDDDDIANDLIIGKITKHPPKEILLRPPTAGNIKIGNSVHPVINGIYHGIQHSDAHSSIKSSKSPAASLKSFNIPAPAFVLGSASINNDMFKEEGQNGSAAGKYSLAIEEIEDLDDHSDITSIQLSRKQKITISSMDESTHSTQLNIKDRMSLSTIKNIKPQLKLQLQLHSKSLKKDNDNDPNTGCSTSTANLDVNYHGSDEEEKQHEPTQTITTAFSSYTTDDFNARVNPLHNLNPLRGRKLCLSPKSTLTSVSPSNCAIKGNDNSSVLMYVDSTETESTFTIKTDRSLTPNNSKISNILPPPHIPGVGIAGIGGCAIVKKHPQILTNKQRFAYYSTSMTNLNSNLNRDNHNHNSYHSQQIYGFKPNIMLFDANTQNNNQNKNLPSSQPYIARINSQSREPSLPDDIIFYNSTDIPPPPPQPPKPSQMPIQSIRNNNLPQLSLEQKSDDTLFRMKQKDRDRNRDRGRDKERNTSKREKRARSRTKAKLKSKHRSKHNNSKTKRKSKSKSKSNSKSNSKSRSRSPSVILHHHSLRKKNKDKHSKRRHRKSAGNISKNKHKTLNPSDNTSQRRTAIFSNHRKKNGDHDITDDKQDKQEKKSKSSSYHQNVPSYSNSSDLLNNSGITHSITLIEPHLIPEPNNMLISISSTNNHDDYLDDSIYYNRRSTTSSSPILTSNINSAPVSPLHIKRLHSSKSAKGNGNRSPIKYTPKIVLPSNNNAFPTRATSLSNSLKAQLPPLSLLNK